MKESEAGEAALQLQFAEKRVASLETHVGSLNGSIKRLEEELDASAKVHNVIVIIVIFRCGFVILHLTRSDARFCHMFSCEFH